jgi:hypothetical protein
LRELLQAQSIKQFEAISLANYHSLDNNRVEVMQLRRELARVTEDARLATFDRLLARRSRAFMSVDTLEVGAPAAVNARGHAGDEPQSSNLIDGRLVIVNVRALLAIGAFLAQEVDIAHLELLDAIDFGLIVIAAALIHALASSIACNRLVTWLGFGDWRQRSCVYRGRRSSFSGP